MRRLLPACLLAAMLFVVACNDGETYADMKEKERKAIKQFINDNDLIGPIKVISESTFQAQDSTTNVDDNEFVLFNEDGIYMQIVRRGEGQSFDEMAAEAPSGTVSKVLLCRFMEYDIKASDTLTSNYETPSVVDKMLCTYSKKERSYTASFTEGYMSARYSAVVPTGWLKPLDYIRLSRNAGRIAKVRLIVPHTVGTSNASNMVLPCYYEISFQLGK